jgi:hypothetical protein
LSIAIIQQKERNVMKVTLYGKTGRALLTVWDYTGEDVLERKRKDKVEFSVHLLPRSANRNTSFAAAGDLAYFGPDLELALVHIRAWTGLEDIRLPQSFDKFLEKNDAETAVAA